MSQILNAFAFATMAFSGVTLALTREDGVIVFTDDNFDVLRAEYPYLLVNFCAPWR